jgi:hypothetical protein
MSESRNVDFYGTIAKFDMVWRAEQERQGDPLISLTLPLFIRF